MWNSLKCYARDLHFGRRADGREGARPRGERAFPICNPPFPEKEERERKGVFYFRRVTRDHFVERRERGGESAPPRISFRRRRQATKTYKSGQMKRETGREYRMDRGAGRSNRALAELLPPPFGAHETSSTRLGSLYLPL